MNSKVISTKKQKWLKVLEYSLPALISIFVYVFAMLCKGISPFGKESICYIDCSDGLIPAYTGLWDWLHGRSSFMVSFNLGAGGSLFSSFVLNGFLSPLSWIIGIFPRESIIYGISLLFIVRFALMATTAYFCFKKFFPKISQWFLLLFAIVWTFSGWTMIHFTNIGWLDLMILLPLLILSAKELVENGKIMWFVIVLSYMLILSYYITYMVLVGTVVIATVYIFTACEKGKRMKVASLLFYGIFISLLISMVTFIPSMVTSLGGHRFSSTANNDKAELYKYFFSKLAVVIMYALPVVFFMRLMFKYKQDKKNVLFFMLSFVICGVGLIIEPINKMWHTGSYYCFPLRYGFVLIMLMIFASLYYIDKYLLAPKQPVAVKQEKEINVEEGGDVKPAKKKYFDVVKALLIPFLGLSVVMMVFCMWIGVSIQLLRPVTFTSFSYYFFLFVLSYAAIELSLRVKTDKLTCGNIKGGGLIFTLCMLQVVMLMTGYLGASYVDRFDTTSRVQNAFNINTKELENGYKLKDRDHLYNYNFPYLVDYASMSSWIHISSEEQYQAYHHLGYNTVSTTLYSSGGTYMTDLLLGNRYVLSDKVLDDSYYTFLKDFDYVDSNSGETKKVNLYELKLETRKAFTTNVDLVKLLENKECGAVILSEDETVSIMVNEEDHIRAQCFLKGLSLDKAYQILSAIDDKLIEKLDVAYDVTYGFLNSCITNIGTGMRASVMMFLPALTISNKIQDVISMLKSQGLTVRGVFGEGSEALSYIYQISNARSLGVSEKEIIQKVTECAIKVANMELSERDVLLHNNQLELKDRVFRAYGILTNAFLLSAGEFMKYIGEVKMGICLGFMKFSDNALIDRLLFDALPSSLTKIAGQEALSETEEKTTRAKFVAKTLQNLRIK